MERLLLLLMSINPMSDALTDYLRLNLETIELKKKEFLLKPGRVCRGIYFIDKGLLRCYYESNGKEITSWLMKEGNIIASVSSFFNQAESRETIKAMENCVLCGISYEKLQYIYVAFPEFNFIARVITEKYYTLWDQRLYAILMQRAPERYQYLMNTEPEIFERVPAKYIASYLGITVETLSRIRAQY